MTEPAALAPIAYAVAAAGYGGFQLTVRFVVYPQLVRVPPAAFPEYERAHQRLVTPLVGLLFGALAVTAGALLVVGPRPGGAAAAALLALLLAVTGFGAVPEHARLSQVFDGAAHRRLLRWDGVRVAIALGQVLLGAALALRG